MKTTREFLFLASCLTWWTGAGAAQPLAKPLSDFDSMVSELKTSSIVGEPIRAGETVVVPFAAVHFGLGSAGAAGIAAGGMGTKTVPLGVVIVEGDNVRVELLPRQEEKGGALQQLIQAILDRKITYMVNGINLGNAPGNIADLTAMMNGMMGQTTVMVNGLNLGNLSAPRGAVPGADKLVADLEAAAAKNPTAENYYLLGEALRKSGQKDRAAAAYRKAIALRPDYPEATKALAGMK
jgi:uncharacterized spore protein YtfJ